MGTPAGSPIGGIGDYGKTKKTKISRDKKVDSRFGNALFCRRPCDFESRNDVDWKGIHPHASGMMWVCFWQMPGEKRNYYLALTLSLLVSVTRPYIRARGWEIHVRNVRSSDVPGTSDAFSPAANPRLGPTWASRQVLVDKRLPPLLTVCVLLLEGTTSPVRASALRLLAVAVSSSPSFLPSKCHR